MSRSPSALPPNPAPNPALQWAKEWSQFAWSIIRDHVRRAFRWNLQTVPVLADEHAQLAAAGVTDPSTQRQFAATTNHAAHEQAITGLSTAIKPLG